MSGFLTVGLFSEELVPSLSVVLSASVEFLPSVYDFVFGSYVIPGLVVITWSTFSVFVINRLVRACNFC